MRREYTGPALDKARVSKDPMDQFRIWYDEYLSTEPADPNSMVLSTASLDGKPSSRIVLLKHYDGDGFYFYSNYSSRKGLELETNPFASLLFYWMRFERQIRIEGKAFRTPGDQSDRYFDSRPVESRISAVASPQSRVVPNRDYLIEQWERLAKRAETGGLSRPDYWGGYRLQPEAFEFWQGRENRLHDRISYTRKPEGWEITRLAP